MTEDNLARLAEKARSDPEFFHALIFNPERVLADLDFLDKRTRGALVALDPDRLLGMLTGSGLSYCDVTCTSSCGVTCSGSSCGYTTNLTAEQILGRVGGVGPISGCDVTCTSSCGATCGSSCGYTTNLQMDLFSRYAR
ncbi:hypothetical protein [Kribbella ginsengisoli]|uniref:Uncharacterized protein n=1 Tax=Kribbella ginsengisoli TaxID=363865 RepID=A0ABP6VK43_9ACTN